MLCDGRPRHEIVAEQTKRYGTPARTTDEDVRRVRERWTQERAAAAPVERERTERRLTALASKLERRGAWSALVQVERLLVDVRGLRPPRGFDLRAVVHVTDTGPETTPDEALREIDEAAAAAARWRAKHPEAIPDESPLPPETARH
jgi:hypothetical protein